MKNYIFGATYCADNLINAEKWAEKLMALFRSFVFGLFLIVGPWQFNQSLIVLFSRDEMKKLCFLNDNQQADTRNKKQWECGKYLLLGKPLRIIAFFNGRNLCHVVSRLQKLANRTINIETMKLISQNIVGWPLAENWIGLLVYVKLVTVNNIKWIYLIINKLTCSLLGWAYCGFVSFCVVGKNRVLFRFRDELKINAAHVKCKWNKFEYFFLAIVLNLGLSCIYFLFSTFPRLLTISIIISFHPHKYYLFINNRHLSKLNSRRECKFLRIGRVARTATPTN